MKIINIDQFTSYLLIMIKNNINNFKILKFNINFLIIFDIQK